MEDTRRLLSAGALEPDAPALIEDGLEPATLPLQELVSPLPLLALAVLALNDHVLKYRFGGWWTGKLSDFAGLIYFPLLLTASINTGRMLLHAAWHRVTGETGPKAQFPLRHRQLVASVLVTGMVFAAVNLFPAASMRYVQALDLFHQLGLVPPSGVVCDAGDLIALPALLVSYAWGRSYVARK